MCYNLALDPSKLESRAVLPSRFAGTSLGIVRGILFFVVGRGMFRVNVENELVRRFQKFCFARTSTVLN